MSMRWTIVILASALLRGQDPPAFRSDVALVHVDAEVTDGIRTLTGLQKDDFAVQDNGRLQLIRFFAQDEEPLDVILLFDISGSMQPNIAKIGASARTAMTELHAGDRVAVMTFHNKSRLVTPFSTDLDFLARTIQEEVVNGRFRGGTRILAGVDEAAMYFLEQPKTQRRRAVLIFTDDFGVRSRKTSTVVTKLWEADASLSGLIVRSPVITAINRASLITNPLAAMLHEDMDGVAEKTGGDTLKSAAPGDGFREMMQRLRRRYSLYYAMPPGKPGERRQVQVALTSDALNRFPSARVRARKGYLVPSK